MLLNESHAILDLANNPATAVDGPNFSGRTDLLRVASGLGAADDDSEQHAHHERPMAYIGPDIASAISGLASTVRAELRLHAACNVEDSPVAGIVRRLGLDRLYDRNPFTLSGGEQACLAITSALALKPQVLSIDCPLEQLDSRTKPLVVDMLSTDVFSMGAKVLLADNRLDECRAPFRTVRMDTLSLPPKAARTSDFGPIDPGVDIPGVHADPGRIDLGGLTFSYGRGGNVIDGLSLSLEPGRVYYLLGQNGAGKSTLAKLLAGVLKIGSGEIALNGTRFNPYQRPGQVFTYHFQNPDLQLFSTTVEGEVVGDSASRHAGASRLERAEALIAAFGLGAVRFEHPLDLPFAMRKRVALAATIAAGSQWIILDEPTLGQDVQSSRAIAGIIQRLTDSGVGVVVITHSETFRRIIPGEGFVLEKGGGMSPVPAP